MNNKYTRFCLIVVSFILILAISYAVGWVVYKIIYPLICLANIESLLWLNPIHITWIFDTILLTIVYVNEY